MKIIARLKEQSDDLIKLVDDHNIENFKANKEEIYKILESMIYLLDQEDVDFFIDEE